MRESEPPSPMEPAIQGQSERMSVRPATPIWGIYKYVGKWMEKLHFYTEKFKQLGNKKVNPLFGETKKGSLFSLCIMLAPNELSCR
jgi:hypothetical protein